MQQNRCCSARMSYAMYMTAYDVIEIFVSLDMNCTCTEQAVSEVEHSAE